MYDFICPKCFTSLEDIHTIHYTTNEQVCQFVFSKKKKHYVYAFLDETLDLVKIGYSTNVRRRLHEIRKGNNNKVSFLYCFEGSLFNEHYLHKKFKDYRVRLEWFSWNLEIESWFENHPNLIRKLP